MSLVAIVEGVNEDLQKQRSRRKYLTDPVLWAKEYLGIQLWSKQREVIYSIRDNRNTAVAAGHGVGKSVIAAVAACWWVDVHPQSETFVATTAPSFDQVAVVWDNIRKYHQLAQERFEAGLIDHPLPGNITTENKWRLPNGSLIGQGRKPPDNKDEVAFQGRHATYLLAIGDEAVGISQGFLDALGNIATGPENRQLLIANPTDPNSAMAKKWKSPGHWNLMHISVLENPMFVPDAEFDTSVVTGMSGQDYVDEKLAEWGEDDARYISRVLGQWAFDKGYMVFTPEDLAHAKNTCVVPDPLTPVHFGVDVARSPKGDYSVVYQWQEGEIWRVDDETGEPIEPTGERGEWARFVDRWRGAPLTGNNPENLGSDYRIDGYANEYGARVINIDAAGGYGQGVKDGLVETIKNNNYVVIEVFGGATEGVDRRMYTNTRASNYFDLKRKMQQGLLDLDPADEILFDELQGLAYEHDSVGRIKIEAKDDMKKKGKKSPDSADALWYACMDVTAMIDPDALRPGDRVNLDPRTLDPYYEDEAPGSGLPWGY